MIVYLDTSALVKVFVEEAGRQTVRQALEECRSVATAMVSYAEARATFARLLREDSLTPAEHAGIVEALDGYWRGYQRPAVTDKLVGLAGRLAKEHALRGYDAVQLASAILCDTGREELRFLAFDERLNGAARDRLRLYGQ